MLLVVLGHTLSGSTSAYGDSFLYQVIWTLQMPLFIIISGYVTRYSRPIVNALGLWKFVKKRTLAYLLPWVMWTILVRALIFDQTNYLDLKYLFWHMDSGYWFLITIWTISIIFGVSGYLSNKISSKKVNNVVCHLGFCGVGMVLLASIGLALGLSFFSIKLTLYYLPIYLVGYLYGQVQEWLQTKKNFNLIKNCCIVITLALWLALINRIDFSDGSNSGLFIICRFVTSLFGCVAVIGLLTDFFMGGKTLLWVGFHSLEVYLIHYFSLCLLKLPVAPTMCSVEAWLLIISNFIIVVALSCFYIRIIESNKILNKTLFWK